MMSSPLDVNTRSPPKEANLQKQLTSRAPNHLNLNFYKTKAPNSVQFKYTIIQKHKTQWRQLCTSENFPPRASSARPSARSTKPSLASSPPSSKKATQNQNKSPKAAPFPSPRSPILACLALISRRSSPRSKRRKSGSSKQTTSYITPSPGGRS